ncbi:MAG: long-chain-acyl-CoA synthetase, partial [Pseudomonadota bacterium]
DSENLVADDLERSVDKHRNNVAFRFNDAITTYSQLDARANAVAHWALDQGLKPRDVVALFMENKPDYVAIWYGLSKIGVVTALINNQLADKALAHCVNIAGAKALICDSVLGAQLQSARPLFDGPPALWSLGGDVDGCEDLEASLAAASRVRPSREYRENLRGRDLCLYVYTSGTTGLPKAARITQSRMQGIMRTFVMPTNTKATDRLYLTLPLYHSTGGLAGVGVGLNTGASIILRRKFSASRFWDDVSDQGATVIVYIGELCRYLLNQPPHPKEQAHRVRVGFGNGIRPDIWQDFQDRFNIKRMVEFYGSTEGNVNFINLDGQVGTVGRIPKFLEGKFAHVAFVKFDIEEEAPVRGEDGFCIRTDDDEPGEVIGRIGDDARTRFEGYNDKKATEKKLLRDVFETGDLWFRTGDLMRKDANGYVYFVDRVGDTFRWKGENVSTNEVAEAMAAHPNIDHANVYGVSVPNMDGRAGMAAVTPNGDIDMAGLYAFLRERLPAYAVPLFIRIQQDAETTGTFKYRKVDLVKEGFDPQAVTDPLYFYDPAEKRYTPVNADAHKTIVAGGVRF